MKDVATEKLRSPFADEITAYLRYKRRLGKRYETEEYDLRLFDRYLWEKKILQRQQVTNAVIVDFLSSRPRRTARSYNGLLGDVRRFFGWLTMQGKISSSPVSSQPMRRGTSRRPFILNSTQVERLLDATATLKARKQAARRGHTYRMIFALLYTLGLRVSEARNLKIKDVDFERNILTIRESKFSKTRLVPFGPNLSARLFSYMSACSATGCYPENFLFSFDPSRSRPIKRQTIGHVFRALIPFMKLKLQPGQTKPRLHDLRHSMAVGTLLRWYQEGRDPSTLLLQLSTFLGHADLSSTTVYLEMTEELLQVAGRRFEQFAKPLIGGRNL
ncbi:MAG: tyrosine-type recombinase/integrase [Candidatus Obscuribacterales bacterium]|nr:tyrosine-type recombinase/integrase [Candidatus Obscuribacterales bacterium]